MAKLKVYASIIILLITPTFIVQEIREGLLNIPILDLIIFAAFLVGAIFAPFRLKEGLDDLSKRDNATKRLDKHSLFVLSTMSGFTHIEKSPSLEELLALRHLSSLELIELDAFPFKAEGFTWGYYLTDLGRYILTEKFEKKDIFPKEFCELIRVRYWECSPKKFLKKKKEYKRHILSPSWDRSWRVLDRVIRKIQTNKPEDNTLTIINSYLDGTKPYDTVMRDLVIPWQEEMKK